VALAETAGVLFCVLLGAHALLVSCGRWPLTVVSTRSIWKSTSP
jgi:hypothetical protein